jgi:hypothetical protein
MIPKVGSHLPVITKLNGFIVAARVGRFSKDFTAESASLFAHNKPLSFFL